MCIHAVTVKYAEQNDLRAVVSCQLSVVSGQWSVVRGQGSVIRGQSRGRIGLYLSLCAGGGKLCARQGVRDQGSGIRGE